MKFKIGGAPRYAVYSPSHEAFVSEWQSKVTQHEYTNDWHKVRSFISIDPAKKLCNVHNGNVVVEIWPQWSFVTQTDPITETSIDMEFEQHVPEFTELYLKPILSEREDNKLRSLTKKLNKISYDKTSWLISKLREPQKQFN